MEKSWGEEGERVEIKRGMKRMGQGKKEVERRWGKKSRVNGGEKRNTE